MKISKALISLVFIANTLIAEEIVLQNGLNGYYGCIDSWTSKKEFRYEPKTQWNFECDSTTAGSDEKLYVKVEASYT